MLYPYIPLFLTQLRRPRLELNFNSAMPGWADSAARKRYTACDQTFACGFCQFLLGSCKIILRTEALNLCSKAAEGMLGRSLPGHTLKSGKLYNRHLPVQASLWTGFSGSRYQGVRTSFALALTLSGLQKLS